MKPKFKIGEKFTISKQEWVIKEIHICASNKDYMEWLTKNHYSTFHCRIVTKSFIQYDLVRYTRDQLFYRGYGEEELKELVK